MTAELLICHGKECFEPILVDNVTWSTERKDAPGQLDFKIINDDKIKISNGDSVRFRYGSDNVFFGFVFKISYSADSVFSVTAYDQLRYLKNKDTYVYSNKTASEVVQMIASDFRLQTGNIENTAFKIASRVESNQTLFDIIQNALDLTLQSTKRMFVLYDDFGKLALKGLDKMQTGVLIDKETAEKFGYSVSIDSDTYNKIKLTYDNEETGKRDVYIAQSGENINRWGVLQYYDTLKEGENGAAKADQLLNLYNAESRGLSISNAFGDNRIRAGSLIPVILDLPDIQIKNYMLVEKCKHTYSNSAHFMDLTLRGGEFVAG